MQGKLKVLITVGHYLPGYKAGGPLKTITNLVEQLGSEFDFWIVTRDRDLGDDVPYKNIVLNEWQDVGNAKIFYASPEQLTVYNLARVIKQSCCDVLYLNSFFDAGFTIKPLLALKFGLVKQLPVVIAPRGEFSSGALQIKLLKKKVYIKLIKWCRLYNGVTWQASSDFEKADILKALSTEEHRILIAKDLPTRSSFKRKEKQFSVPIARLQVVFLSRISPMKNLDYALNILQKVKVPVDFDIYGPKEDMVYWALCQKIIATLPDNISVTYCGAVTPDEVGAVFSGYDLFFFPTRGENYGHVIAESLSVGTPVLISDQTPWRNLQKDTIGWDFPLMEEELFIRAIEESYSNLKDNDANARSRVIEKSYKHIFNPDDIDANRQLFFSASDTE